MSEHTWMVGVDIGGTFTDVIAVDQATGEARDGKVLSTPAQEDGVLAAIASLDVELPAVTEVVHGHTVGINAFLSRAGAKTGLLTTAGHRDLLDIGRMNREFGDRFYDPTWLRPHQERPVVERAQRLGVVERMNGEGVETAPLDEDGVRAAVRKLAADGVESIGVCFINAYRNDAHERRAAEIVGEEFGGYVQSSALYPVTKEHERTTTVALDAYVGPVVTSYLSRLQERLTGSGFRGSLWIMMMNGGVASLSDAAQAPVFQLLSGPVGGVSGAITLAHRTGVKNLITMDVGGTSTEVSTIKGVDTPLTDLWTIEHGLTLSMPLVDVGSVGSGAGSIIATDAVGSLRVGPASAGSVPGPAAYGRGGKAPTLTDACTVLGILQPDLFAGGAVRLHDDLARSALGALGTKLDMTEVELATSAYELACEDVAAKMRSISVYRGVDVREFSLLAFGAAGPMLANRVAEILRLGRVVVPPNPGQFSALGLLTSDLRMTRAASPMTLLTATTADELETAYRELEDRIRADLRGQGMDTTGIRFERAFFAMYAGQTWDNRLSLGESTIDEGVLASMQSDFHAFYQDSYGFSAEELPVMLTTIEVTGVVPRRDAPIRSTQTSGDSFIRTANVTLPGHDAADIPIYERTALMPGQAVEGPALLVESYATTVVLSGHTATNRDDLLVLETEATR